VRCYDNVTAQARFTDLHAFDVGSGAQSFPELTAGCSNYMAAAHWTRNNGTFQAQCSSSATPNLVPACESLEVEEGDDLVHRFFLYSAIMTVTSDRTCFTANSDIDRVEARNGGLARAYQGVMAGRYICSTSPTSLQACHDGSNPATCPIGQCGNVAGFNVAPQSYESLRVNSGNPFDQCCDYELNDPKVGAPDCNANTDLCSPQDVMCASAAVLSVCRSDPEDPAVDGSLFVPLSEVFWAGPVLDIDPGHSLTVPGAALNCFTFSFRGFAANERRLENFTFGGTGFTASLDDACSPDSSAADFRDEDLDGVYDVCDPVLASIGPPDGLQRITIRNRVRNKGFSGPFVPATDEVLIDGQPAVIDTGQSDATKLVVQVPPSTGTASQGIVVNPVLEASGIVAQDFVPRWFGYVSDGTNDGMLGFDTTGEGVRDLNASPTNSYVNLTCNPVDPSLGAGAPKALAVRPQTSPLDPGISADREVFTVSDVWTPALEHRLFGFDVQTHRLLSTMPSTGIELEGSPRAMDIVQDKDDIWRAYIARKVDDDTSTITVVRVDPVGATGPDPLWHAQDGTAPISGPPLAISGLPLGIRAHTFAGSPEKVYAYVTSVACVPPGGLSAPEMQGPGFHCEEDCGGGTTNYRKTFLTVVDVTNPGAMSFVDEIEIASTPSQCSGSEASVLDLQNAGAAFNLDHTRLFIANPDGNRVDTLETEVGIEMNTLGPATWITGAMPVDVAVVQPGGTGAERVYVAGRTSRRIHIIDLGGPTPVLLGASINLAADGQQRIPVAIAARSDGMRLFTADSTHGTVSVSTINPDDVPPNRWLRDLATGPNSSRLVLLRLP
jgi:hypothetical protein